MLNESKSRTLKRNGISKFILRFDLIAPEISSFINLINEVSHNFDRTEKIIKTNHHIDLSSDQPINKSNFFEYVLVNEKQQYSITFTDLTKSFWFETSKYIDYKTYMDAATLITKALSVTNPNLQSKRIGMRFINVFNSSSLRNANKIFNSLTAKSITSIASRENISRVIIQEEYNLKMSKMRIQYGIPNKFYPSPINNYDFLFDIDSFDDSIQTIDSWESVISDLNHNAYDKFIEFINPHYIEELR